jgi:hypothetical protein
VQFLLTAAVAAGGELGSVCAAATAHACNSVLRRNTSKATSITPPQLQGICVQQAKGAAALCRPKAAGHTIERGKCSIYETTHPDAICDAFHCVMRCFKLALALREPPPTAAKLVQAPHCCPLPGLT